MGPEFYSIIPINNYLKVVVHKKILVYIKFITMNIYIYDKMVILTKYIVDRYLKNSSNMTTELSFTDVDRITKNAFINCMNVTYLYLSDCNLSVLKFSIFYHLINLEDLILSNNNLYSLDPNIFHNNLNLSYLDVSFNKLTNFTSLVPSLLKLNMDHNKLEHIPEFPNLPELQNIILTNNQISKILYNAFINCPNIIELYLSYNKISVIDDNAFIELDLLYTIELSYNNLTNFNLFNLNVKKLYLNHNKLEHIPTFIYSSIIHFMIISFSLGFLGFDQFFYFSASCYILTFRTTMKKHAFNILFWVEICFGISLMMTMYSRDYYRKLRGL